MSDQTMPAVRVTKADKIVEFYAANPNGTRKDAAKFAECTVSRVAEVVAAGRTNGVGARTTDTKANAIIQFYTDNPMATRREVAEGVGCTVQRVGEVVRAGLVTNAPAARPTNKAVVAFETAPNVNHPAVPDPVPYREGRCEHEKSRKAKTGSCNICPQVKP